MLDERFIYTIGFPLSDESGILAAMIGFVIDIASSEGRCSSVTMMLSIVLFNATFQPRSARVLVKC